MPIDLHVAHPQLYTGSTACHSASEVSSFLSVFILCCRTSDRKLSGLKQCNLIVSWFLYVGQKPGVGTAGFSAQDFPGPKSGCCPSGSAVLVWASKLTGCEQDSFH